MLGKIGISSSRDRRDRRDHRDRRRSHSSHRPNHYHSSTAAG